MKKCLYYLCLFGILAGTTACPYHEEELYSQYEPLLMSRKQLETSVQMLPARPIHSPGKLYLYGNYLLINEQYKGVHVIDNQDPSAPVPIAFIQVPGNSDFAVKQNVLYVDNAVDLVALDLQNLKETKVLKRIPNTFPALLPPDHLPNQLKLTGTPPDAVVVGWEKKTN